MVTMIFVEGIKKNRTLMCHSLNQSLNIRDQAETFVGADYPTPHYCGALVPSREAAGPCQRWDTGLDGAQV